MKRATAYLFSLLYGSIVLCAGIPAPQNNLGKDAALSANIKTYYNSCKEVLAGEDEIGSYQIVLLPGNIKLNEGKLTSVITSTALMQYEKLTILMIDFEYTEDEPLHRMCQNIYPKDYIATEFELSLGNGKEVKCSGVVRNKLSGRYLNEVGVAAFEIDLYIEKIIGELRASKIKEIKFENSRIRLGKAESNALIRALELKIKLKK